MPSRRIRCSVCNLLHNAEDIRRTSEGKYICKDCIENSNGEYIECDICHIVEHAVEVHNSQIFLNNMTDVDGKTVCSNCLIHYYYQCQDCHTWTLKSEIINIQGHLLCPECQSHFTECPECGRRIHRTDLVTVHRINGEGEQMCRNCADRIAVRCNHCEEYFHRDLARRMYPSGWICNDCADHEEYYTCSDCGAIVHEDNMVFDDEEEGELDNPLCRGCYDRRLGSVIHNYHCDENFVKKRAEEDKDDEPLYLGLEIEVGGNTDYARDFLRIFRPNPDIMLMRDSSVRGFEIVTNPMTYNYIQKHFYPKLEEGMRYLISKEFKGHNEGGIHIHISQEAVTKYQVAQLSEILYGNKNDYETWLILTQRSRDKTYWCRFNKSYKFYDITDNTDEKPRVDSERHTALNYDSRTGTYEFRIFNSSLRMDRIKKNIQCVIALLDYTSDHKYDERPVCHLTGFLEYVMARKLFYPELAAYIDEKHLLEAHKNKNYSNCNTIETERNTLCA